MKSGHGIVNSFCIAERVWRSFLGLPSYKFGLFWLLYRGYVHISGQQSEPGLHGLQNDANDEFCIGQRVIIVGEPAHQGIIEFV